MRTSAFADKDDDSASCYDPRTTAPGQAQIRTCEENGAGGRPSWCGICRPTEQARRRRERPLGLPSSAGSLGQPKGPEVQLHRLELLGEGLDLALGKLPALLEGEQLQIVGLQRLDLLGHQLQLGLLGLSLLAL